MYKSDGRSVNYRMNGNMLYNKKDYFQALYTYNQSISYSESYENLSLGYANRSAVYYEIGRYEECLKNIEWARKYKYPKEKISKLNEREEKCKKMMNESTSNMEKDENCWDFFKLSYPANKKIPWIVNCLEVRKTKKYGRGIYTNRDLKIGDIICVDEPEMFLIEAEARFTNCGNCYQTCMLNLIPSSKTACDMFCSNACMDQFYSKVLDMNTYLNSSMMFLIEVVNGFGGIEEFNKFANHTNLKNLKKTIFDFDFSNKDDPEYKKNIAMCLLSLQSILIPSDNFTKFNEEERKDLEKYVSRSTANHILGIIHANGRGGKNSSPDNQIFPGRVCVSAFQSLINHSCVKNVGMMTANNKCVMVVTRPIKAGEQIFDDYMKKMNRSNVRGMLNIQFKFVCDCLRCTNPNYNYVELCGVPRYQLDFVDRNNLNKSREHLKEGWNISNTFPYESQESLLDRSLSYSILHLIKGYCTFPC